MDLDLSKKDPRLEKGKGNKSKTLTKTATCYDFKKNGSNVFCCHGGDGAHTGVKLDDHVDIRVAFSLVGLLMLVIIILSVLLPWTGDLSNDDDMMMSGE
jgi:hypothetical protein